MENMTMKELLAPLGEAEHISVEEMCEYHLNKRKEMGERGNAFLLAKGIRIIRHTMYCPECAWVNGVIGFVCDSTWVQVQLLHDMQELTNETISDDRKQAVLDHIKKQVERINAFHVTNFPYIEEDDDN